MLIPEGDHMFMLEESGREMVVVSSFVPGGNLCPSRICSQISKYFSLPNTTGVFQTAAFMLYLRRLFIVLFL